MQREDAPNWTTVITVTDTPTYSSIITASTVSWNAILDYEENPQWGDV